MTLALVAALCIGQFLTALVIAFFVLFAELVEGYTVGGGRRAIQNLMTALPHRVTVRRGGEEREVGTSEAMPAEGLGNDQVTLPVPFWRGLIARMQGDSTAAESAFLAAHAQVESIVRDQPNYASGMCALALIDAGLGRKQQAIEEGRRACELLPITKDSINGIHIMGFLAVVYAWTGEKDLKLHPFWDPLRGDPRFEQIVASLAPK